MRPFLLRAILGVALLPVGGPAQVRTVDLRSVALWQVQPSDAQSRPAGSYVGVRLSDIDVDRARILKLGESRGVEIKAVEEGSPADKAGIQPGDVLLSYNGENVGGAQQLIRLVQETPSGRRIKVQMWREGKERSTIVTTGAVPHSEPPGPIVGFTFSDGRGYPASPATLIPRPVLVWRDALLGIDFEPLDSPLCEYFGVSGGVLVRDLEKGLPAEKSGMRPGDVIVSVRHKAIATARDFTSCLRASGSPVPVTLVRNHKKMDVMITVPGSEQ